MRVIIIEDKDATELLRRLELVKLQEKGGSRTLQEMHRKFRYEVVRWLQDQGADLR